MCIRDRLAVAVYNDASGHGNTAGANRFTDIRQGRYAVFPRKASEMCIRDSTSTEGTQVIKPSTAFLLTSAMQDVVTSGTGTAVKMCIRDRHEIMLSKSDLIKIITFRFLFPKQK